VFFFRGGCAADGSIGVHGCGFSLTEARWLFGGGEIGFVWCRHFVILAGGISRYVDYGELCFPRIKWKTKLVHKIGMVKGG
jgi:hypothetical protein